MKRLILVNFILCLMVMPLLAMQPTADQYLKQAKQLRESNRLKEAQLAYIMADSAFVAEKRTNSPEYAETLHGLGVAYISFEQYEQGRQYAKKAMELRRKLFGELNEGYITTCNNYALSFLFDGKPDEALKIESEVVKLDSRLKTPHPEEALHLFNLGRIYKAKKDDANMVKYFEAALSKTEKHGKLYEILLESLGLYYVEHNDVSNGARIMNLAKEHNELELLKEPKTPQDRLDRADYYISIGDNAKAKEQYLAVFEMKLTPLEEFRADVAYAKFLGNTVKDYSLAAKYLNQAAQLWNDEYGASETVLNLRKDAALYQYLGKEYSKAVDAYNKVLADMELLKTAVEFSSDGKLKAQTLRGLAYSLSAMKRFVDAVDVFDQLIAHYEALGQTTNPDYPKAIEHRASARKFSGDYENALKDYDKAIALFDEMGLAQNAEDARTGRSLCEAYAGKQITSSAPNQLAESQREAKLREIIKSSKETLEMGGEYLGKMSNAETMATIAGAYYELGDVSNAIDYYQQYIKMLRPALVQSFLMLNAKDRELMWQRQLETIEQMNEAFCDIYANAPNYSSKLASIIYEGQLLSKGILLNSNIEFEKILQRSGNKTLLAKYDAIKQNLNKIEKIISTADSDKGLLQLVRDTEKMQLELAAESAKIGGYTDFLKTSMADVVESLQPNEAAVEFLTVCDGISTEHNIVVAVVATKEAPEGIFVPVATEQQLKLMAEDPKRNEDPNYTALLWGVILDNTQDKTRIYFAPAGILNRVGIEYLPWNEKPLSEQMDLIRVASTKDVTREYKRSPFKTASLFGDIDYTMVDTGTPKNKQNKRTEVVKRGNYLDNLEYSREEVEAIEKMLKQYNAKCDVQTVMEGKASKAAFFEQLKRPLNLLHVSTHGMYIDDEIGDAMSRSLLAFAGADMHEGRIGNPDMVSAAEIAQTSLPDCELAVLSSCDSGLGKLSSDGVLGLQRGFKQAGVKSVLVSLNPVSDKGATEFMISFYRHLLFDSGATPRSALRAAQAEYRAAQPSDDTWASFILVE